MTRVNVGKVNGGTASNIVAEHVDAVAKARGETIALMEYVKSELIRRFETAAEMHGCEADVTVESESPRADSDPELAGVVANIAEDLGSVDTVLPSADFGASEDATFLMKRVQNEGGLATYLIIGTDHPTSHHTPTFDVDERSLETGVEVLTRSILSVTKNGPEVRTNPLLRSPHSSTLSLGDSPERRPSLLGFMHITTERTHGSQTKRTRGSPDRHLSKRDRRKPDS